jgi:hypothetical protein
MGKLPTIRVKDKEQGEVVINESQFDHHLHEPVDARGRQLAEQQHNAEQAANKGREPAQGTPTQLPPSPEGAPDPSIKNTPDGAPPKPVVSGGTASTTSGPAPTGTPTKPAAGTVK